MSADVTIIGAGIAALTTALALADRGVTVRLIGTTRRGEASTAAGGLLAPSVEPELSAAHEISVAAREYYVIFAAMLEERAEVPVMLNRNGALQLAFDDARAATLASSPIPGTRWLSYDELIRIEPSLARDFGRPVGALWTPDDGCVDPPSLLNAIQTVVARSQNIIVCNEDACEVKIAAHECDVITNQEGHYTAPRLILAAGAWTPLIKNLPRPIPVEPLRGQMMEFEDTPLSHIVFGPGGYLVPKGDSHVVAGSTAEPVGFDASTTPEGLSAVRSVANRLCPALEGAAVSGTWAGLRPVTPDLLPILGPDPDYPHLLYACGHSRNGILLSPYTAQFVADCVTRTEPSAEGTKVLQQFGIGRL